MFFFTEAALEHLYKVDIINKIQPNADDGYRKTGTRKNRVLIVGNGFDLDCGFDTSYQTFCSSHFSNREPLDICKKSKLYGYLSEEWETHSCWFNLEDKIRSYLLEIRSCSANNTEDKDYFDYLIYCLSHYVPTMGWTTPMKQTTDYVINNRKIDPTLFENSSQLFIRTDSVAYELLRGIAKHPSYFERIVSFNYTNLSNVLNRVIAQEHTYNEEDIIKKIDNSPRVDYLHIDFETNNIVLGIEDGLAINPAYSYMQKSNQMSEERRQNVINSIMAADELVIFGHSLGQADADYFKPLFEDMFAEKPSHERKITFITYNDNREILKHIKYYAGGKNIIPHHSFKNLSFIYTSVEESRMAYSNLPNRMS